MKNLTLTTREWLQLSKRTGLDLGKGLCGAALMVVTAIVSSLASLWRVINKAMMAHPKVCCAGLTIVFAVIMCLTYAQLKTQATTLTYQRDSLQMHIDSIQTKYGVMNYKKIAR